MRPNKKGEMMNLCELCIRDHGSCMNDHENIPTVVFCNDEDNTNDAVIECDWFMAKPKKEPPHA